MLLSLLVCLLCPSSCLSNLIDCSSAGLKLVPLIVLAGLAPMQLINCGFLSLRSMQLKLMRRSRRRSSRQHR